MFSSRSLTLGVLVLGLVAGGCDRQSDDKAQQQAAEQAGGGDLAVSVIDRSHKGSALPDFTLADPAGKQLAFASLTGKPVLINLWATWCAPCIAELPQLDALAAKGAIRVVTVSQDLGEPGKVAEFLKARGVSRLEPWLDPEGDVAMHYAANTLPMSILYDSAGHEVWRVTGPREWGDAATAKALAEAR